MNLDAQESFTSTEVEGAVEPPDIEPIEYLSGMNENTDDGEPQDEDESDDEGYF